MDKCIPLKYCIVNKDLLQKTKLWSPHEPREGAGFSYTLQPVSQSNLLILRSHFFSFFNLAHAHFILKMAAVQGGMVDEKEEVDIKTEPQSDGFVNTNATDGRQLSPSPGSSSSAGSSKNAAGAPEDQQTLLAVLQFLRKNKLTESVEILRREAGLPEDALDSKGVDCGAPGSGGSAGGVDGLDAGSLLSRVTVSSSAGTPAPTKGMTLRAGLSPASTGTSFAFHKARATVFIVT